MEKTIEQEALELVRKIAHEDSNDPNVRDWKEEAEAIVAKLFKNDVDNELPHCPSCKSTNVEHKVDSGTQAGSGYWWQQFYKVCNECGAATPKYWRRDEAIADWNAGRVYIEDFPLEGEG